MNITNTNRTGNSYLPDIFELAAFHLTPIQLIVRIVSCVLGLLCNIAVAVVIARSRQLWSPRNIFWLGITLCEFIAVIESAVEVVLYFLHKQSDGSHKLLCQIFSTQLGYTYGLLMAGLTLASLDRYSALKHHQFYQKHATSRNALLSLVITFFIMTGVGFFPFWTGFYTIECGVRYKWLATILFFHAFLSLLCLGIHTRLYIFIRKCIRYAPAVENLEMEPVHPHHPSLISSMNEEELNVNQVTVNRRKNRLEIRAACILMFGIFPFCLVNLTVCILALCVDLKSPTLFSSLLMAVMTVCRELLRLHFVYIPIVFVTQSREFHSAVKRFHRTRAIPSVNDFN